MKCEIRLLSCGPTIFQRSLTQLRKNCLIRFCTIHYMFCISFFHVSLQQARITTSDHVNMIKNYRKKQLIWLIFI